jgi:hypothetical protein
VGVGGWKSSDDIISPMADDTRSASGVSKDCDRERRGNTGGDGPTAPFAVDNDKNGKQ